jgi:hypothetical protein
MPPPDGSATRQGLTPFANRPIMDSGPQADDGRAAVRPIGRAVSERSSEGSPDTQ